MFGPAPFFSKVFFVCFILVSLSSVLKKTELHINVNLCRWNSRRLQSIKSKIAGNTVFFCLWLLCDSSVYCTMYFLPVYTSYTMIQTSSCYSPMLGKILEFDKALRCLQILLLILVNNFVMNQKKKKSCSIHVYVMFYVSDTTWWGIRWYLKCYLIFKILIKIRYPLDNKLSEGIRNIEHSVHFPCKRIRKS